ncbi:MAG: glycoside hydrolase family 2 TIM barrel-domain containing protein [Planctomycetota bacterium]
MKQTARYIWMTLACLCLIVVATPMQAKPVPVELKQTGEGWQLLRDGEPFQIKGAGGDWGIHEDGGRSKLQQFVKAGGNSIRTWGVDDTTGPLLDVAHELGLTVTVGLWLGHERHGFDYTDLDQVAEQKEKVRQAVETYKDHPAVLAWGVGNEMEGYDAGDNAAIWSHVEAVAAMIKRLDPHHPTMTVIAEIGGRKLDSIHRLCPSIDIVGINTYAGAASIPERYAKSEITKPYIVAEFGPAGTWEVGANAFGAPVELTSTEKAPVYARVYDALKSDKHICLGSYAFLWGSKVEATTTWFGMYLPDGSKLAAVDAMTKAWSGKLPDDLCPAINAIAVEGKYEAKPGAEVTVTLDASDPEGKPIEVEWALYAESSLYFTGGDKQKAPPAFPGAITSASNKSCTVVLPEKRGIYRLYAVVKDPSGHAAVANVPLSAGRAPEVKNQVAGMKPGQSIDLPAMVYAEGGDQVPWVPAGYMGNTAAIQVNLGWVDNPKNGVSCLKLTYTASDEWGGVVWQDPINDWGDRDGGYDLRGATALEFWARGEKGGEVVTFGFGVLDAGKKYPDSGSGELKEVRLTDEWRKYRIELGNDVDLQRIKTGFYWSTAGQGKPVTFYLDDVGYVGDAAE